jgi:hypothetical protein
LLLIDVRHTTLSKLSGVSVQRSRWPEKRPVKSKKKLC